MGFLKSLCSEPQLWPFPLQTVVDNSKHLAPRFPEPTPLLGQSIWHPLLWGKPFMRCLWSLLPANCVLTQWTGTSLLFHLTLAPSFSLTLALPSCNLRALASASCLWISQVYHTPVSPTPGCKEVSLGGHFHLSLIKNALLAFAQKGSMEKCHSTETSLSERLLCCLPVIDQSAEMAVASPQNGSPRLLQILHRRSGL